MDRNIQVAFKAEDRSYFSILKKDIHAIGVEIGFNETKVGELDIVIAEMTSNLLKHASGGQIIVRKVADNGVPGIEILSVDNGPGMSDVSRMVADGVSTKSS